MWTHLLRPVPDEGGVADSVLILTAIILLLRPLDAWWLAPFVLAAACLSLVVRAVRRAPITWLVFAGLVGPNRVGVAARRQPHLPARILVPGAGTRALQPRARGHAVGEQSMAARRRLRDGGLVEEPVVSRLRRWSVFRVTLLTDERFADASLVFGGLSRAQIAETRSFLEPLPVGAALLDPPTFVEPARLRVFAAIATWGGLLLESLVALVCLTAARFQRARHASLLAFCAPTYGLAPVAGFGWLIATMGLAQCRPTQRLLGGTYLGVFVLILLYTDIPWTGVLAEWTAR